ncbi:helix-turn-helix transcriptional regulator [Tsuneonella sp. YG55]|uniref:Helix-turn-helix transcriptional regulator n=1 Tax=Tsuneonella litorea TaxID=2976475 RepID=A0A9X3A730_9SPHN|nr:helix-turn-helix transcriptional regulator [Tsuneonella litorea]MCT2557926.1 helix-turn-helix transcriptional regulator [Tsuneonella litorea]
MSGRGRQEIAAFAVLALQALAAAYFIYDGAAEGYAPVDIIVGLALLAGIAWAAMTLRTLHAEAHRRDRALAAARGALSAIMRDRFAEWNLSAAETEVALFALKGCPIAEIARLRGAAQGTVRSQLSQVYAKAGVGGQSGLMALFLDDLIEPIAAERSRATA